MAADLPISRASTGNIPPRPRSGPAPVPVLVVVGSVSTDRITTPAGGPVEVLGGAGLYAALGAAATGGGVGLFGVVGAAVATAARSILAGRVDATGLTVLSAAGPRFDITYDSSWRAAYRLDDAGDEAALEYVPFRAAHPRPGWVHLCPTGPPEVQYRLATALRRDHAGAVCLSATTFGHRIRAAARTARSLWRMVDLFVLDVDELRLLAGTADLDAALDWVSDEAEDRVTCVTDGQRGGYLVTSGTVTSLPAYPVATVDPTGAGEAFAGALAAACWSGMQPHTAAMTTAAVASLAVQDFGTRGLARAMRAEVRRRAAAVASLAEDTGHGRPARVRHD